MWKEKREGINREIRGLGKESWGGKSTGENHILEGKNWIKIMNGVRLIQG